MEMFRNLTLDGFLLSGKKFHLPTETLHLNPKLKREMTICNLFVNHHLTASDIIRILDEDYGNIVSSLIKHEVVLDRRKTPGLPPARVERRRSPARGK